MLLRFSVLLTLLVWPRINGAVVRPAPQKSDGPVRQIRWIGAGGGSSPANNPFSLEADLALAEDVLGTRGDVFFAGGSHSQGVQVQQLSAQPSLRQRLGTIFAPRPGRDTTYRATQLASKAPATADNVLRAIAASTADEGPLNLFLATHGEQGGQRNENALLFWGGWSVTPRELDQAIGMRASEDPVRLVATACYSGGFAELVFRDTEASAGATPHNVCGFFSTTWDREATGCDPDPDRRLHQGYGVHFLQALRGRTRQGQPLLAGAIDFDGDGLISYLEAHSFVRLHAPTIDVPTSTSERWLRATAPGSGALAPVSLPEEEAVIAGLAQALGLVDSLDAAHAELDQARLDIHRVRELLQAESEAENDLYLHLAAALLARWPVLEDPWHPEFETTLSQQGAHIEAFLARSSLQRQISQQQRKTLDLERTWYELSLRAAPLERLVRALDTRDLASRARARGGAAWETYERLLACERGTLYRAPQGTRLAQNEGGGDTGGTYGTVGAVTGKGSAEP